MSYVVAVRLENEFDFINYKFDDKEKANQFTSQLPTMVENANCPVIQYKYYMKEVVYHSEDEAMQLLDDCC